MSAACGPGTVPINVDDMPEGWEAFATNDGENYFGYPEVYYYCRALTKVQWSRPGPNDAQDPYEGPTIGGKNPYRKGDEFIPNPPPGKPTDTPFADDKFIASCEDPDDVFQPDEDMLEACIEGDLKKLQGALSDGADVSIPNNPWQNTPLHLAIVPPFWDAESLVMERQVRLELVQWLLRNGADATAENVFHCKPVDFAAFHGYAEIVSFLQAQSCKLGWFGAAYLGDLGRIKELLEEGQDIDQKGRFGRTAFCEAKLRGHWEVEAFLSQLGCSKALAHSDTLKFNPAGAAIPRGVNLPSRERQYYRTENAEWYDDMMEKRFPGYKEKTSHVPGKESWPRY